MKDLLMFWVTEYEMRMSAGKMKDLPHFFQLAKVGSMTALDLSCESVDNKRA